MQRSSRAVLRQAARVARAASAKNAASSSLLVARVAAPVSRVNASLLATKTPLRNHVRAFSSAAPVDVPVPSMGDSISEGTVVEWLKKPGDAIAADDVVVVLETDKVSVDVRAPFAGTLVKQLAAIDENVSVGAPLFQVAQGDVAVPAAEAAAPAATPEPAAAAPAAAAPAAVAGEPETVVVPSMGDSISEGTIVSWLKSAGDSVVTDDVIVVIETDKVSVDVRAPKSGVIQEVLASVDEVVAIGAPLFKLVPGAAPAAVAAPAAAAAPAPAAAAPAAAPKAPAAPAKAAAPAPAASSTIINPLSFNAERVVRREKMSRMRLRTAERLKESQNVTASLTTFQELDMTNIMNLRKTYKDEFEKKHGVKLGFMSAFIKASASALLEVPGVNAMIDDAHQEIVYRDFVDMSVAVSTPKGLVTPVIQNTESMSFADIEKKLAELAEKARAGKLTLEEMTGGNFTISNGGVFGSLMGTPIINLPQTAILGMHATKMRPVVHNGQVTARPMMYLALTYDHRLVDGREAVTALKSIADKVENPERLLLDL